MIRRGNKYALLVFGLILSLMIFLYRVTDARPIWAVFDQNPLGLVLAILSLIFVAVHLAVFIWRIVLCLKYRSVAPCDDDELPTVSVVVPAYNEGRQVLDTLESIMQSDFPKEKMSVIGVDDGSQDDTWFWLKKAERAFPGRVRVFRQPVNRGKRHALYRGFTCGDGEVFVTIDSDSTVAHHTLRHLVSPFARNPRVGAMGGNVRILNYKEGLIPKMLEVAFAFSFDFMRAGQSVINSVMCTPGALSAYRRSVVMEVLDEWVNQKFCGRAANIGEDRAMTNLILRSGYHVHYQRKAVVYTTAPTTVSQLWKMLLRWARSNVRESIAICRFVFRRFRSDSALGLRINVVVELMNLTLGQVLRISAVACLGFLPLMALPKIMIGAALAACTQGLFYTFRHKNNRALFAIPYSYFYMACLSWIGLYALISPHKSEWMTRGIEIPTFMPNRFSAKAFFFYRLRGRQRKAA